MEHHFLSSPVTGESNIKPFSMSRRHLMMKMHIYWTINGWCRGNKWLSHIWHFAILARSMMTSSNGNIFRFTGPLYGNSPVTSEFPSQWLVTRNFDVFFDLCLNKRLSKQSRRRWFETSSWSLWRHYNDMRVSWTYRYCHLELHCWMKYI